MESFACVFVLGVAGFIYLLVLALGKASQTEVDKLKGAVDFLETRLKQLNERLSRVEKTGVIPAADLPVTGEEKKAVAAEKQVEKLGVDLGPPPGTVTEKKEEMQVEKVVEPVPIPVAPPPPPVVPKPVPPPAPRPPAAPAGMASQKTPASSPFAQPPVQAPPPVPLSVKLKGLEKKIGIYLAVWIGSITIAIAGGFLVKYSIERNLLSDTMKITLATLLGTALLVAGEVLRKKTFATAQGASAAGVAVLYAAFLAGTVLYKDIFSPTTGFALLCLVTAAAIVLSLRQGIIVAIIGLIGGFFTPYLIGHYSAEPSRLFLYMILLQGALAFVTQKRNWKGLAFLTFLLGIAAVIQKMFVQMNRMDSVWVGLFILVSAALFVLISKRFREEGRPGDSSFSMPFEHILSNVSIIAALASVAALAVKSNFSPEQWVFLGILGAATIILAVLDQKYEKLPIVSFVLITVLMTGWIFGQLNKDRSTAEVFMVCAGFLLLYGLVPFGLLFRGKMPTLWGVLSCLGGLVPSILAWVADKRGEHLVSHWGFVAIALGLLYLIMAVVCRRLAEKDGAFTEALASFCVATTVFVSFAVPLELKREWISVAWAIEALALGWLLDRFRIKVIGYLGILVSLLAAGRLLLNPSIFKYPIGEIPILNWVLYGYGIPACAFALAAIFYRKARWFNQSRYFAWLSGAFTFALLSLETRHYFHPSNFPLGKIDSIEWATYSNVWLLAALILLVWSRRIKSDSMAEVGSAFMWISMAKIVVVDVIAQNPLLTRFDTGEFPLFNWLLYIYGVPLAIMLLARRLHFRKVGFPSILMDASYLLNHLLSFVLVSLEVRHFFHPGVMTTGKFTLVECATYSHFWILLSALLLVFHLKFGTPFSLQAGGIILVGALAKIFVGEVTFFSPVVAHHNVGGLPVLNWLIYVYLVPAALLYLVFRVTKLSKEMYEKLGRGVPIIMISLVAVLLTFEVRQFFHGAFLDGGNILLNESATYSHLWLVLAALLIIIHIKFRTPFAAEAAYLLVLGSIAKIILRDILGASPLFYHHDVGSLPVMNWLVYVYFLPIILLYGVFRISGESGALKGIKPFLLYFSMFLSLFFLTLEVRQFFHGNFMDDRTILQKENYAYSVAWIVYSFALLIFGVIKDNRFSRIASLVVIYLAVAKVFVYDLRHLKDLYRVASFLGLGISLLAISYLYQRFVFGSGDKEQ